VRLADERHMTAKRKPSKAALVLTDDDRAVLSSLPEDERAMVEKMMRRHAGRTAAEALQALRETGMYSTGQI
jgi:DNA-binding GntR family transcriptional regulator